PVRAHLAQPHRLQFQGFRDGHLIDRLLFIPQDCLNLANALLLILASTEQDERKLQAQSG
ncbi:MAG TPA: hypothetical protein VFB79_17310, partial [Candidatus Angelobacter sp.]|nr:hypothetical protein [Candidatus Angelobacter sp.]